MCELFLFQKQTLVLVPKCFIVTSNKCNKSSDTYLPNARLFVFGEIKFL